MPDPSTGMEYPNRRPEDADVEMKPIVLGPGSYSSPDPNTESARLLPLNEHPLKDSLSPDFAKDVAPDASNADESEDDEISSMTVEELDDTYGDEDGYPKSGNKAEKVKFARSVEE